MNEGKHETNIQGDVYGLAQGDHPQVTMHFHHPPFSRRERRDRKHFLARVRAYWIEEKLKQSLQGTARIALGLKYHSAILASPQQAVLQTEDMSITQAFDTAAGKLLILGEEGAGKTTLLLELTRDLLERAEKDEDHPMPVVLNLSSWSVKSQALTEWIIEELQNEEYEVPSKVAEGWVKGDQLLLLLDGLDEMSEEARGRCIEAINS
jgi:predicted NACHT family NTPase